LEILHTMEPKRKPYRPGQTHPSEFKLMLFVPAELPIIFAGTILVFASWGFLYIFTMQRVIVDTWHRPQGSSLTHADRWILKLHNGTNRTGFFLDIHSSGRGDTSNSKLLEQHGWQGVCVSPGECGFRGRKCRHVTELLGPRSGQTERLQVCKNDYPGIYDDWLQEQAARRPLPHTAEIYHESPFMNLTTIGFAQLLETVKAPQLIEYTSLSVWGSELEILESFPWSKFCVNAWTVEHQVNDNEQQTGVQELLQSKGCQVSIGPMDTWALCSCPHTSAASGQNAESRSSRIVRHVSAAGLRVGS